MSKRRPWCERAKSLQANETVTSKDVWKHSHRMFWGGLIQAVTITSYASVWCVLLYLHFGPHNQLEDDLYAPGFWEIAFPILAIATAIFIFSLLIGFGLTLPGKAKMKRILLPGRCQSCPKCLYDLSARPRDDDTCPECGLNAPRRECVRLWCKLLRSRF